MPLSNKQIAQLIAGGRTRNAYAPKLDEFLKSDEPAVDVLEAWPIEFKNKKSSTIYQGFNNAIKNAPDAAYAGIQIRQSDGHVYVLHTERVNLALTATADTDN